MQEKWTSREVVFSKCYKIISDRCTNGLITEEEAERQWDKMELMSKEQLVRMYYRLRYKNAVSIMR
jgi:hypothetical protein